MHLSFIHTVFAQIVCITPAMDTTGAVDLSVSANAGREFVDDSGLRYIVQPKGQCQKCDVCV